jgi:hypothetical protein
VAIRSPVMPSWKPFRGEAKTKRNLDLLFEIVVWRLRRISPRKTMNAERKSAISLRKHG